MKKPKNSKISFDNLYDEDNNNDGYFGKPDDHVKLLDNDYNLLENRADEVDDLIESTNSASSISSIVNQNNEDMDKDTPDNRERLLEEIESELGTKKKVVKKIKRKDLMEKEKADRKIVNDRDRELNSILESTNNEEEKEKRFLNEEIEREEMTKDREILLHKRDKELSEIMKTIEDPTYVPQDVNKMIREENKAPRRPMPPPPRKPTPKRSVVTKKDYSNLMSPKFIIGGVILIVVVTVLVTVLVMKTMATDSGTTISRTDRLIVRNPINNYTLEVGDVLTRVSVPTANGSGYDLFTKIRLTIKNKKRSKAALMGTNQFIVKSYNGETLGDCYTANELANYNIGDAIPSTILARTTATGYLYCKTDINYLPLLEITVTKEIDQSAAFRGEIVTTASSVYTINLNQ